MLPFFAWKIFSISFFISLDFYLQVLFFNCILFFVVINSVDSAHQSVVFYNEISPSVQITLQDEGTLEFQEEPFEIAFHCDFVP